MSVEIYLADFHFYFKKSNEKYIVKDVITKRIPTRFILNEGLTYKRAIRGMQEVGSKFLATLQDDKETGLKKFTIHFTKKIGEANDSGL